MATKALNSIQMRMSIRDSVSRASLWPHLSANLFFVCGYKNSIIPILKSYEQRQSSSKNKREVKCNFC